MELYWFFCSVQILKKGEKSKIYKKNGENSSFYDLFLPEYFTDVF